MLDVRCAPSGAWCFAICAMAARIRRVTATRTRSALDEARRLRPPRPVAPRSCSEIVARLGVPELLPELANAPSIRSLRLCVEDVARVAEVTDDLAVNGSLGLRRHLGVRWNERGERRHANLRSRIAQQVNEQ